MVRPNLEQLEGRDVPSVGVALNPGGVLAVTADQADDYVTVSGTAAAATVFVASENTSYSFSGVNLLTFQGGQGNDTFLNLSSIGSVQRAGNGPSLYVLQGGTGPDTLIGSGNPAARNYLTDTAGAGNVFVGGAGFNNIFGGSAAATDVIYAGPAYNQIYDIVGADTVYGNGTGVVFTNTTSTVFAAPGEAVVTFGQNFTTGGTAATLSGTANSPFVLQPDVNGNNVLYLVPPSQTAASQYYAFGDANDLTVLYLGGSPRSARYRGQNVAWIAFFGAPVGGNVVANFTAVNDVLYAGVKPTGASGTLIGGFGVNVLKGHSGNNLLVGPGTYNDLSAGANGTDVLVGNPFGINVYRNRQNAVATDDEGVHAGDVVLGVPQTVNGQAFSGSATAQPADYAALFALQEGLYGAYYGTFLSQWLGS